MIGDREACGADAAGPDATGRVALRLRDGRQLADLPVKRLIAEVSRQVSGRSADLGFP